MERTEKETAKMKAFDLYKRKCKQCGKGFEGGVNYAYKIPYKGDLCWYFCSWHCIQAYRATHKDRRKYLYW